MASDASHDNPLIALRHPIAFDRIRASHVQPAIAAFLDEAESRLAALENDVSPPTYDNTLRALSQVTDRLECAMAVVSHLESVATSDDLRAAYNDVQLSVSAFHSEVVLSSAVYERIRAFAATPEARAASAPRTRFLRKTLSSFEREGARLHGSARERLREINMELSKLTARFAQNVLDSTNSFELMIDDLAKLAGLPPRALDAAISSARARGLSGYRFTLHESTVTTLLTFADDASLRERMYRAYYARSTNGEYDNRPLVERILSLRSEKARLLGYSNFVDLVVADRMVGKAQRARTFLEDLRERFAARSLAETAELAALRTALEGASAPTLESWDTAYYAEKKRKCVHDLDEEQLRAYFPLDRVIAGLFELLRRLYGVRVEPADLPVWHPSVHSYHLRDEDGSELGSFYTDLFHREQKLGGAWTETLVTGEPTPLGWTPHVGVVCANMSPTPDGRASLLSHREVRTLLHEFGHLMHVMLSRVDIKGLTGTKVAWDFVELPSQLMENFAWERESLDLLARHHESGARIPEKLLDALIGSRTFLGGCTMMRQLGIGMVDLLLHMRQESEHGSALEYAHRISSSMSPTPLPSDYAMIASSWHMFGRPVGYAGGYYSYKWAEALEADAFSRFRAEGILSRQVGLDFRRQVLAHGDSAEPLELLIAFMGRAPSLHAMLDRCGIEHGALSDGDPLP